MISKSQETDLFNFLQTLISIPSVSGNEEEVIQSIQKKMIDLDYDEVLIDPFGNCIGRIGSGKHILAIDGHCDTVDAGNRENWEYDPFKPQIKDNTIYGRGAADQKGGLSAAIYAGGILKKTGLLKNISLLVIASVLEEDYEGLCWQYIIKENQIRPEAVLLTEPTNLSIAIGQRGRLEIKIRCQGISCHGSAPARGINAIYKSASIINEIKGLNETFSSLSPLRKGSIAITDIRSQAPSLCAVPDQVSLHCDRRLTQDESMDSALKEVRALSSIQETRAKVWIPDYKVKSFTGFTYPVQAFYPSWLMEVTHPLVKHAVDVYKNTFQQNPVIAPWTFSTNGVATKGIFNIPTIGFGPGEEQHAHASTDQVKMEDVIKSLHFYIQFVSQYRNNFQL